MMMMMRRILIVLLINIELVSSKVSFSFIQLVVLTY